MVSVIADGSRTIIPEIINNLDSLSVTLTGPGGVSRSGSFSLGESMVFTELPVGTWTVLSQGLNAQDGVIASAEESTIIREGSNSLSMDLEPNMEGSGAFDLTVSYPDGVTITSIQGRVTPYGQTQGAFESLSPVSSPFTFAKTNLPAGYYLLELNLYDGTELKAGIYEILWIINGVTTEDAKVLTIDDMELPLAPTEFSAASTEDGMLLTWVDNSNIETSYRIEKSLDDNVYNLLTALSASSTTYTDGNVQDGQEYFYRIKAVGDNGDSPWVKVSEVYDAGSDETGDLDITVTIVDPQDLPDVFQALGELGTGVVTVNSVVVGASEYSWRVNGIEVGTASSYSLDPATLSAGIHTLSLVVTVNGSVYSETAEFVVDESPITQTPVLVINDGSLETWESGDFTVSPQPASYSFQGEGTVYLSLTMSSDLGTQEFSLETVPGESLVLPAPTFSAEGSVAVTYAFSFYAVAQDKDPSVTVAEQEITEYTVEAQPDDGMTIYVESASGAPTIWAWFVGGSAVSELESMTWPGDAMESDGGNWYKWTLPAAYEDELVETELSFHLNGVNTVIYSLDASGWRTLDGQWKDFDPRGPAAPTVSISPSGGSFQTTREVTITYNDNGAPLTSRSYTLDGVVTNVVSDSVTITLDGEGMAEGETLTLSASATNSEGTGTAGPVVFTKSNQTYTIPETLGALYTPQKTVFRLWSPDHSNVTVDIAGNTYNLTKRSDFNGYTDIYETEVPGDHHLAEYQLKVNGVSVRDPYGIMVVPGTNTNVVLDLKSIEPDGGWAPRPALINREDAIIYEVHVRDFTIDSSWTGTASKKGTFAGMVESGTTYQGEATGLDHLKELGVTHVQILPFYDFSTPHYNWGYDPRNFNVPEEQYSRTPNDYVNRVKEVMNMINEFHKNDIRVVMDVVYNHTYSHEAFENITEQYYTKHEGKYIDLSGTGNSIDSGNPMVSRMIKDSLEFWVDTYNVTGYRFDLIGIFHTDAVRDWGMHINNKFADRNILMYGEPWNGYASDPLDSQKVRMGKVPTLADARVGVFNGKYREDIKGNNDGTVTAYMFNGGTSWWGAIAAGSRGSLTAARSKSALINDWDSMFAYDPEQSINYISAHDNFGLWDKVYLSLSTNVSQNGSHQVMSLTPPSDLGYPMRVNNFGSAMVLTSQGIPFLHAGDELLRTKTNNEDMANPGAWNYGEHGGTHNTYNSPDSFNSIKWGRKATYSHIFDFYVDAIALRKAHPGLRLTTWDEINTRVRTEINAGTNDASGINVYHNGSLPGRVVVNYIDENNNVNDGYELIVVFNNANNFDLSLPAGNWTKVFDASGATSATDSTCEGTAVTVFAKQ
jgi:pullulanase